MANLHFTSICTFNGCLAFAENKVITVSGLIQPEKEEAADPHLISLLLVAVVSLFHADFPLLFLAGDYLLIRNTLEVVISDL